MASVVYDIYMLKRSDKLLNWFIRIVLMCKCQSYVLPANDKTQNPGIPGENYWIYSRFHVIVTSSCISRVSVSCHLLNLSMDNSTVLGFPDTSGDYRSLVCKYRTPYMRETLPR